jgi:hypothetical protein
MGCEFILKVWCQRILRPIEMYIVTPFKSPRHKCPFESILDPSRFWMFQGIQTDARIGIDYQSDLDFGPCRLLDPYVAFSDGHPSSMAKKGGPEVRPHPVSRTPLEPSLKKQQMWSKSPSLLFILRLPSVPLRSAELDGRQI